MEDILTGIFNFILSVLTGIINLIYQIGEGVYNAIVWIVNAIIGIVDFIIRVAVAVLQFFADLLILIINAIISLLGGVIAIILMVITVAFEFIIAVITNIIEVIRVVALAVDVIFPTAVKVVGWILQAGGLILEMLANVNAAPANPIPYLPRCITAPLESQICALWYTIEWTVIAPDTTPGILIVPLITLMIDLVIVVYIVRSVFKLIKWFQSLYQIT